MVLCGTCKIQTVVQDQGLKGKPAVSEAVANNIQIVASHIYSSAFFLLSLGTNESSIAVPLLSSLMNQDEWVRAYQKRYPREKENCCQLLG